jgi:dienelactone hydrolase
MSAKKILKWILLGIVLVVVGFGVNYLSYERQPLPEAVAALQSDDVVTVTRKPWLTFSPNSVDTATGFIFYPGGRISYLGYSDMMRTIAENGYLVLVPKMPLNIAFTAPNVADEIIAAHPEITHWVIGGHSVGGTFAAQYTFKHPENIDGLAIWSSYPADSNDISSFDIPVVLMYGSNELGVTDESVGVRKHLLPVDTHYVVIEGGDHHQFGTYALTTEEDLATISREAQHEQILAAMLELLKAAGLK